MAVNSSSQVSYLVLDSLSSGSKYGLEIIEYISQKTNGDYILKKPTLYSCLTRMEKKGLVSSSYWGESELGGKRHYYTITNEGKRELETLAEEYQNASFSQETKTQIEAPTLPNSSPEQESTKPVFLQQDNLFDIVKQPVKKQEQQIAESPEIAENQIDIFSFQENLPKVSPFPADNDETAKCYQDIEEQPQQDDGKFLSTNEKLTEYQEAQNRRLYDSSHDINKYKKRKSFSENQIEMAMVYDNAEDREIQKDRIAQLKKAMLDSRQNIVQQTQQDMPRPSQITQPDKSEITKPNQDDAVFITDRMHPSEVPIQKKITPTNIEVNIYDDNLPAPKRDTNLEPTYKDMMAKLFERKKEKTKNLQPDQPIITETENKVETFSDYSDLKRYYAVHNIEFKEYKKTRVQHQHNTNLLKCINSAIMLCLSGIGSAVLYAILFATNMLQNGADFLFYTLPIVFASYTILTLIIFKMYPSKKPKQSYGSIVIWATTILATIIVLIANILCGMTIETITSYLTSLCIPTLGIIIALPVNYYTKKILYKKYGK